MTTSCSVPDHGPTGSETLPRLHHHGPSGGRLGHGRFDNCRHCQAGMPLFEAAIPEPIFPAQECSSCGREHPGEPCPSYDTDLFGGAS